MPRTAENRLLRGIKRWSGSNKFVEIADGWRRARLTEFDFAEEERLALRTPRRRFCSPLIKGRLCVCFAFDCHCHFLYCIDARNITIMPRPAHSPVCAELRLVGSSDGVPVSADSTLLIPAHHRQRRPLAIDRSRHHSGSHGIHVVWNVGRLESI